MSSTSPMIVALRDLPQERHIELSNELIRDALAGLAMRDALDRPPDDPAAGAAQADLSIYMEEGNVFVRGPLTGWLEVACSRCLGPARITLDEDLAVTYLPRAKLAELTRDEEGGAIVTPATPGSDTETSELGLELTGDDLDLYGFEGEEIVLEPLFRDQIILAVPFAPLCSEECKGLCPQCGVDRNLETCDCRPPIDPRWAAIQNLKP